MKRKFKLGGLLTVLALTTIMASACTQSTDPSNDGTKDTTEEVAKGKGSKYVNADGSILVGKDGAVKQSENTDDYAILDVYFDPMCPGCGEFERQTGEYLNKTMAEKKLLVRYHPLMFLDEYSTDSYSSRTSAYILGIADHAPELSNKFIAAIFDVDNQPDESNYTPVSNEDLNKIFKSIGGTDEQAEKINKDLENNMTKAYESTLSVMKSTKLTKKSPTGSLYTPFIIPNEAGKEGDKALTLQGESLLSETKAAVDKLLK